MFAVQKLRIYKQDSNFYSTKHTVSSTEIFGPSSTETNLKLLTRAPMSKATGKATFRLYLTVPDRKRVPGAASFRIRYDRHCKRLQYSRAHHLDLIPA